MKKILISAVVFAAVAISAGAQTMYDALTFGKDNYYGTARTIGLGNAITAIGGDLGTLSINPAGSAVAGYSQFTFSQGLAMASTSSSWASAYNSYDETQNFSGRFNANKTRYIMPNIGFSFRFDTGNSSGLKSWNFAFLSTMTNNFCEKSFARGFNAVGDNARFTSLAGALATGAMFNSDGFGHTMDPNIIFAYNPYNTRNSWNNYDRWQYIVAYQGGLINWNDDAGGSYYGANELKDGPYPLLDDNGNPLTDDDGNPLFTYFYGVPGRLAQNSQRLTLGSKNDITMNFGFNVDDNLFLGFNLSFPVISYRYTEAFTESADDTWPAGATVTPEAGTGDNKEVLASQYFNTATYRYDYDADISGVNASVGFIWLPTNNLRLGASIKTPTAYTVKEKLKMQMDTHYELKSYTAETPIGEFTYDYRSPYSISTGLACTFGTFGLFSADYQMTDYSVMRYSINGDDDFIFEDPYEVTNRLNELFCGVSHSLRVGVEVRPLPFLAFRAGYSITTDPERYYIDNEGYTVDAAYYENNYNFYEAGNAYLEKQHYVKAPIKSYSVGLGYISTGSFYADFAFRRTRSSSFFSPYVTYLEATDNNGDVILDADGNPYMVVSPCVRSVRSLFDAILTVGWRF